MGGIIVAIFLALVWFFIFGVIFKDEKSDITKLKEALKDTDTLELNFVKELVENELKSRVTDKKTIDINLNDL